MQDRVKPLAALVAIFAITLQAVFAGLAGGSAIGAPLDPATIICHSDASDSGTDRQTPATQHDCCSQCVLSNTPSVGTAPDDFIAFVPSRQRTAIFIPFSAVEPTPLGGLALHPARGPPRWI
jgi:hypothetical protein